MFFNHVGKVSIKITLMYLLGYGTRPEAIKLFPLAIELQKRKIPFKVLFTGQHEDLANDKSIPMPKPDIVLKNVMKDGQSINSLLSKIIVKSDKYFNNSNLKLIVQGDAESGIGLAISAFNNQIDVIHLEAGLRTNNINSPFPEEMNRRLLSQISNVHFCHSKKAVDNLKKENITNNVYLVGNTVVDSVDYILKNKTPSKNILNLINRGAYFVATMHRRENRDTKFKRVWSELENISSKKRIIYITHPSVKNIILDPSSNIDIIQPVNYVDMIYLLKHSGGVFSDSGGIQEEVTSLNKFMLICRDTTERKEIIDAGLGILVNYKIEKNLNFLYQKNIQHMEPIYGQNVSKKIVDTLEKEI